MMSQEWLKKLAELSNDKDLVKRAQQMQQKAQKAPRAQPVPASPGGVGSLLGALFGSFFRWLFLFALAEAAAMVVVAQNEGLANESWGYIFHYGVWYVLTQPVFPPEAYTTLRELFSFLPPDLPAFYNDINPILQEQQDALVFYAPAAAALAVALFFLPATNARRRRSPIRVLVLLANLAAVVFFSSLGESGAMALWLGAFVFSFVGGGRRAPRPQPQTASPPAREASQPQKASRPAAAMPATASTIQRAARPAAAGTRREPTVVRRGEASWIRAR